MALLTTLINQYRINWTPTYDSGGGETVALTPKVSDAHHREIYSRHSIQITNPGGQTVVVQISNVLNPIEGTDADWFTVDSSTSSKLFEPTVQLFRWVRFKVSGGAGSVPTTINLLSGARVNS